MIAHTPGPKDVLDKKPPHGAACTRCGGCCMVTVCPLGQFVFKREVGPCPALSFNAEGSVCGLVADPMRFAIGATLASGVEATSKAAAHMIGSGQGCDARFNGEPADEAFYRRQREWDHANRAKSRRAKKIWGIK
jgi:hypothetical protein